MAVILSFAAMIVGALLAFGMRTRSAVLSSLGAVLMVAGGVAFIMALAITAPR